jgi:predicted RNA-binding Zn ribbon-like protein
MDELDRVGGALCLDFVNTVEPRWGPVERDHLHGYADLLDWARQTGTLDTRRARRLRELAARQPGAATTAFDAAITLREAVYDLFAAIARGTPAAPATPGTLHLAYAEAMRHAALTERDDRYEWTWPGDALELPSFPVALSAVELLRHGPVDRIKTCPTDGGGCGWLFLDATKNHSRRWCSMQTCGAEVKTRHQTARRRAARRAAGTGG